MTISRVYLQTCSKQSFWSSAVLLTHSHPNSGGLGFTDTSVIVLLTAFLFPR